MIAFIDMLEYIQEICSVLVVFKDGFLCITARLDVIHLAGVFYAKRS